MRKHGLGLLVFLHAQDDVRVLLRARHKGIEIFDVDIGAVEDTQGLAELSWLIADLDADHVNDLVEVAGLAEDRLGGRLIVDDKAQNAKVLRLCDREGAEVDPVLRENVRDVGHGALLILNKNG